MKTIVGGLTFLILVVTAEDVAIAQRNRSPEQLADQNIEIRAPLRAIHRHVGGNRSHCR